MVESFAKLIVEKDDSSIVMFAKMEINGHGTGLEKHHYVAAIQKRADELFPNKPSPQQRFARALDSDPTAQLLMRACKRAGGSEVKPGSDTPEVEAGPRHLGPGHARKHGRRPRQGEIHELRERVQLSLFAS